MSKRSTLLIIPFIVTAGLLACSSQPKEGTLGALGDEADIKIDTSAPILSAREKAMDHYKDFMTAGPNDTMRVEALRRMANIELERSEEVFLQKMQEQEAQLQAEEERLAKAKARIAQQKGGDTPATEQDKAAQAKARYEELPVFAQQSNDSASLAAMREQSYKKAISLYEQALAIAKGRSMEAEILYQMASAYEQAGRKDKAIDSLSRLVKRFPGIPGQDEIHFRRGELYFSLNRYEQAQAAYEKSITSSANSAFYEKSLSKMGWAQFKQNDYDNALGSFFLVVDRKLRGPDRRLGTDMSHLKRGEKELLLDVFRVITLSFNEMGGAEAAAEYFRKNGVRPYTYMVFENLGKFYMDQERYKDAGDAYETFVARYPLSPKAYEFDIKRIEVMAVAGFTSLFTQSKQEFADKYRIDGEYWNKQDADVQTKLLPVLAQNVEDIARHYHAQALKTKRRDYYSQAVNWYRHYIKSFPNTKNTVKMNFLLAEALFENKQFDAAAKEYEKTAYQYSDFGRSAEAGYAAILAYQEQANRAQGRERQMWEGMSVGSALRFGKFFPKDKRASQVLLKASQDLFALNKYAQAAKTARSLLQLEDIDAGMRKTGWLIVAQSELRSNKYAQAESAYKIALKLIDKGDAQRKDVITGLAASIYKLGEQLKQKGDHKGAVQQFARVIKEAPDTDIAVTAQFDMAASYVARQDWNNAIAALEKFRDKYPQHKLGRKATENLALAYLENKQPDAAAREFESIMSYQSSVDVRRDMMWRVAELYEEAGLTDRTIDSYKRFIKTYPGQYEQAMEARQKLADIALKRANGDQRQYWLKQIVTTDNRTTDARTDRTRYLAAKASYELARPYWESFETVRLVEPLKKNLARKKQKMQEAVTAFTQAADYGVAEVTTASVYWLAEIYNKFSRELMKSERPKGLSGAELEQYDILLEEQAYPFEEKSIDIHESNAERVYQGIYDEWIRKSFAALSVLRPVRYRKAERSESLANEIY